MKKTGMFLNIEYGCIFGSYWMIYGIVSSFAAVFLQERGFSNSQIGITLAVANVLAVVMQPLIADFADRSGRIGVIGITEIMTVMMMVFTLGMFIFTGRTLGLCLVFVLLIAWHTVLQPLFNSLSFRLEESGVMINFGLARSVGSLAYSLLVAVLGTLIEKYGVIVMPWTGELVCLCLLISLIFTGRHFRKAKAECTDFRADAPDVAKSEGEEINLITFARRNKMFMLVNLGVVGLYFSNSILNNYMAQIVDGAGGTTEDMGRILSVMAFLEIPTMVVFNRLKKKFSCTLMLKVAAVGFTVKIAICRIAESVVLLYVAQLFQLVSFALFLPAMVYFTDQVMSRGEAIKGQALFTTMVTVTTIFASLLGGFILDKAGPEALLSWATAATAAGAVIIIAVIDKVEKKGR